MGPKLPYSALVYLDAYGFEGNGYFKMLIKRTGNIPVSNIVSSFAKSQQRAKAELESKSSLAGEKSCRNVALSG